MNILNRIQELQMKWTMQHERPSTHILLGQLELMKFEKAMRDILGVRLDDTSLKSGSVQYMGLIILPLATASHISVGTLLSGTEDADITHIAHGP